MASLRENCRRALFSFVSLTNTQSWITRFLKADQFLPEICAPRFAFGAGIPLDQSRKILAAVPSLASRPWTEYWIEVGKKFEATDNFRAACMSYIMAAFPKEHFAWKDEANERKRLSFKKWCSQNNFHFEEILLDTPAGKIRYYLHIPESAKKVPVTLFLNGLEGSAEEIAFPLQKFRGEGSAYVTMSIPGSADYEVPMTEDSDKLIRYVIDELEKNSKIDSQKISMVGFSFGAYWTLICTKTDPRIKFALCNGTPYKHTFNPEGSFGLNPVLAHGLMCIFQVKHPLFLLKMVRKLTARAEELLQKPSGPILAIDGENDSIVDPRDTELVGKAPGNRLLFIKNDDHCGLFHYERMNQIIVMWTRQNLGISKTSRGRSHFSTPPAANPHFG